MIKVKLPAPERPERWSELPSTVRRVSVLMNRREFLKALAVVSAALAMPLTRATRAWAGARGRPFTRHDRATLSAYVDRIIPPDGDPGAKALGVPRYIERLLTAFDKKVPRLFAGGPFSNRNPLPDNDTGTPSRHKPKNDFKHFIRPTRLQELTWRAELFGSADVPEVAALDAQNGGTPLVGLRDVYRAGLAMIDAVATQAYGRPFVKLTADQQDDVFTQMEGYTPDPRRDPFNDIVLRHTLEGCFGAPEYGGNKKTRGWQMLGLEGDSQPLGYSIFDRSADLYRERADHPMTTINPDEASGPHPLTSDGQKIQTNIATFSNAIAGSGEC
jgi:hypothetical protein